MAGICLGQAEKAVFDRIEAHQSGVRGGMRNAAPLAQGRRVGFVELQGRQMGHQAVRRLKEGSTLAYAAPDRGDNKEDRGASKQDRSFKQDRDVGRDRGESVNRGEIRRDEVRRDRSDNVRSGEIRRSEPQRYTPRSASRSSSSSAA